MSTIPSWAIVGQAVVCVHDFGQAWTIGNQGYLTRPVVGVVYHILSVEVKYVHGYGVAITIALVEFEPDHGFDINGFRPVVRDQTEATIFRHLRQPRKIEVDA